MSAPADNGDGARRPRVLVADDHQLLLDRVVALLATEFSVIGTVTDGEQLVEAEAALQPDVLVVDISMPRLSGLEATLRIRSRGSRVPVVCLTAHTTDDVLEAAWDAGAVGYVAKASLAHDLIPAIRAALEGRRFVSMSITMPSPSH